MSTTFGGFSEEDLKRIKSSETGPRNGLQNSINELNSANARKLDKLGSKLKKPVNQYRLTLQKQASDDAIDSIDFQHCKLSIRTPTSPTQNDSVESVNDNVDKESIDSNDNFSNINMNDDCNEDSTCEALDNRPGDDIRKSSTDSTPDIVRGVSNYTEDELAAHKAKLEGLQLKQKLMEEQNKKRKEMLAKALADRTKQTEEEVMRLEKIKKELQVLDGQFSQDVAVLRKRIDQACVSYADAEKHYLKVEKEFLQAKINLQKEREKKELLTEHLCALITHNETRKAQKLETLMLELATDKKKEIDDVTKSMDDVTKSFDDVTRVTDDEEPIIVDGVDQRTGKMVELPI